MGEGTAIHTFSGSEVCVHYPGQCSQMLVMFWMTVLIEKAATII